MRFIIEKSLIYFCCSTLPLLNGDISIIINDNTRHYIGGRIIYRPIPLLDMFSLILDFLNNEYDRKMPRKIKREYKRMINLYTYRLKEMEVFQ